MMRWSSHMDGSLIEVKAYRKSHGSPLAAVIASDGSRGVGGYKQIESRTENRSALRYRTRKNRLPVPSGVVKRFRPLARGTVEWVVQAVRLVEVWMVTLVPARPLSSMTN